MGTGLAVALALVTGTACSGDDDEGEEAAGEEIAAVSVDALAQGIEASTAGPFRYELGVTTGGADTGPPLVTGASDGERLHLRFDANTPVGSLLLQLLPNPATQALPADADRSFELIVEGEAIYLRSPIFPTIAALPPGGPEATAIPTSVRDLAAQLGDGWGRVDRAAFAGLLPEPLRTFDPSQGVAAALVTGLVDAVGGVEELGTEEVDGEELTGLAAEASLEEVFGAVGMDPTQLPTFGGLITESMAEAQLPVEIWSDDQQRVRQVRLGFGAGDDGTDSTPSTATPDAVLGLLDSMDVAVTLDVSDYGDDSIVVEAPTDALDVSQDAVGALLELVLG